MAAVRRVQNISDLAAAKEGAVGDSSTYMQKGSTRAGETVCIEQAQACMAYHYHIGSSETSCWGFELKRCIVAAVNSV